MTSFPGYDDWKCTPPDEEDVDNDHDFCDCEECRPEDDYDPDSSYGTYNVRTGRGL